jgi:hypothetical protein
MEAAINVTISSSNTACGYTTKLHLGEQKLEIITGKFVVTNSLGEECFAVNETEVNVKIDVLKVTGTVHVYSPLKV